MSSLVPREWTRFLLALSVVACSGSAADEEQSDVQHAAPVLINVTPVWSEQTAWRVVALPSVRIALRGPVKITAMNSGTTRLRDGTILVVSGADGGRILTFDQRGRVARSVAMHVVADSMTRLDDELQLRRLAGDTLLIWYPSKARFDVVSGAGPPSPSATVGAIHGSRPQLAGTLAGGAFVVSGGLPVEELIRPGPGVRRPRLRVLRVLRVGTSGAAIDTLFTLAGNEYAVEFDGRRVQTAELPRGRRTLVAAAGNTIVAAADDSGTIAVYSGAGRLVRRFRTHDARPARSALLLDGAGYVWVRSDDQADRSTVDWRVFAADGRYQGNVAFPRELLVDEIGADYVLGRVISDSRVASIRLYRLIRGPAVALGRHQSGGSNVGR